MTLNIPQRLGIAVLFVCMCKLGDIYDSKNSQGKKKVSSDKGNPINLLQCIIVSNFMLSSTSDKSAKNRTNATVGRDSVENPYKTVFFV